MIPGVRMWRHTAEIDFCERKKRISHTARKFPALKMPNFRSPIGGYRPPRTRTEFPNRSHFASTRSPMSADPLPLIEEPTFSPRPTNEPLVWPSRTLAGPNWMNRRRVNQFEVWPAADSASARPIYKETPAEMVARLAFQKAVGCARRKKEIASSLRPITTPPPAGIHPANRPTDNTPSHVALLSANNTRSSTRSLLCPTARIVAYLDSSAPASVMDEI